MRGILSSNHSTLKTQVETQQTSIARLEASMTAMQTSMNNVLAAQEADLKLAGVQILPLSDSLTPNPPLTRSEIAFEKGRPKDLPNVAPMPQAALLPSHAQTSTDSTHPDLFEDSSDRPLKTLDPRRSISLRASLPPEFRTTLWFKFDNMVFSGIATTPRAAEGIIAQAKKVKKPDVGTFLSTFFDDWIDEFEDWCEEQLGGSPYTPGLDEQIHRIFLHSCEKRPDFLRAYRQHRKMTPPPLVWSDTVAALHEDLMPEAECERRSSKDILHGCAQGSSKIVSYNHEFNSLLQQMQRYGGSQVLMAQARQIVKLYITNLAPYFNHAIGAMTHAGLSFDTPTRAYRNFHAIQLYLEQVGRNATTGSIADAPSSQLDPPLLAAASYPAGPDVGASTSAANNTSLDPMMWDLINGLDRMQISDEYKTDILRLVHDDRNRVQMAAAPAVHFAMTAPPPDTYAAPFASPAAVQHSQSASSHSKRIRECWLCHEPGHIAAYCPQKATWLICTNCEERGHYSKFCPQPRGMRVDWMIKEDRYESGSAPRPPLGASHGYSENDREAWRLEQYIYVLETLQNEDRQLDFQQG